MKNFNDQVAALMGHNVVQVACGQSSDHQVLALTDAGCIYSWVGAGQGGQVPKLIEALSGTEWKNQNDTLNTV